MGTLTSFVPVRHMHMDSNKVPLRKMGHPEGIHDLSHANWARTKAVSHQDPRGTTCH